MPLSASSVALALLLLTGDPADAAPPSSTETHEATLRVELTPEPPSSLPEICIAPEQPVHIIFNSELLPGSVELQGERQFGDTARGQRSFSLVAPKHLEVGERFKLTARFVGRDAPESVGLWLVGQPRCETRTVEVFRHERSADFYRRAATEARAEAERLREELAALRARQPEPGGLRSLIAAGVLGPKAQLAKRAVDVGAVWRNSDTPRVKQVMVYRLGERVAVELILVNSSSRDWNAASIDLCDPGDKLVETYEPWRSGIIPAGGTGTIVVEAASGNVQRDTSYRLIITDDEEERPLTIPDIVFPPRGTSPH